MSVINYFLGNDCFYHVAIWILHLASSLMAQHYSNQLIVPMIN
jgi:hypothetical protein